MTTAPVPRPPILRPIGVIRTPFPTRDDCPRNGRQLMPPPLCHVQVDDEFAAGLADLEGFSHLILLYWLDRAEVARLRITPPFDGRERGIFATRSPDRPNPIGLAVVELAGFATPTTLAVRHLDCIDGTPLLDIKPYVPSTDAEPSALVGWLAPHVGTSAATPKVG